MNYLAHLLLAGPADASRIGNLLGDFAKGTPESLRERFPAPVVAGIVMHRALDRFTDDHPAFHRVRALLPPERRRFAGIVIDIFFDHFLTLRWPEFSPLPLPVFVEEIYQCFERHPDWLGEEFAPILPRLRRENWLMSYGSLDGVDLTLRRVSQRSPRLAPIAESPQDLRTHYQAFAEAFGLFFPDARDQARRLLGS